VKTEQAKIGINIKFLMDEQFKHNAVFYASQIKDEATSVKMVQWLIDQGVDASYEDSL
jgi:hypothetical protein